MLNRRLNGLITCDSWIGSLTRAGLKIDRRVPRRIRCVGDEVPIVVRRTVGPLRWSSFA